MQKIRSNYFIVFYFLFLSLLPCLVGWAEGEDAPMAAPQQYAIRHLDTPCAIFLLNANNHEKAIRITDTRSPEELAAALNDLKNDPIAILESLQITDLSQVVIGSVGAPLNSTAMKKEAAAIKEVLAQQGLSHIPVKIFPRPYTFLQKVRGLFPIASDWVGPTNQKQEADAQRRGVQITASANIPTYVTLAFMGPGTNYIGWLVAVPPTTANLIIDYYLGKHRNSANNFLARAGKSRLSAIFRDAQISFLFAVPFYLIPRFTDFVALHASQDISLFQRFLAMEFKSTAFAIGSGAFEIFTSCMLHALEIFSFMNPNSVVDKILIDEGTTLSESELDQRNAWRVAGFFAITAPIFAIANNPANPHVTIPLSQIPLQLITLPDLTPSVPHLLMAGIAATNYFAFYANPKRMLEPYFDAYQRLGWFMSEVVSEWLVVRPAAGIRRALSASSQAVRGFFGRRPSSEDAPQSNETTEP